MTLNPSSLCRLSDEKPTLHTFLELSENLHHFASCRGVRLVRGVSPANVPNTVTIWQMFHGILDIDTLDEDWHRPGEPRSVDAFAHPDLQEPSFEQSQLEKNLGRSFFLLDAQTNTREVYS
jgi:hypothetical protein